MRDDSGEFPWVFDVQMEGHVTLGDIRQPNPCTPPGFRWIHLDLAVPQCTDFLDSPDSGIGPVAREALLSIEARPRIAIIGEDLLVVLRGVNLNPGADIEDMVSLRALIGKTQIVTVERRPLLTTRDVYKQMISPNPPRTRGEWIVLIIDRLVDRMREPTETIGLRFDEIELQAIDGTSVELRRELNEVRRISIGLKRYLTPQRDAMQRLASEPNAPFTDHDRLRIREETDRVVRILEDLEADRDRAKVTQEELAARVAESMNQTTYILTLFAGFFLPLGFVTGLLGINVGGVPGVDSTLAFWVVCGICVALSGLQFWYFKRRHFFD